MTTAAALGSPIIEDRDVLAAARGFADQAADAELGMIVAALEWAHRNPGDVLANHSEHWGSHEAGDVIPWEELSGLGCPLVDDLSIPEFAYAADISERVARTLIQESVVMFYRFPRTWSRMVAGGLRVWRARLVPRYAGGEPHKVAKYVDRHLDAPGARVTISNIRRLIDEARHRFVPEAVAEEQAEAGLDLGVEIDTRETAHLGLGTLTACLDLPDALDLEAALSHGAARLKELGSTAPLEVRRAHALGDLARSAQNLPQPQSDREHWDGGGVPRRGVKMYIHLNHTALRCTCAQPPGDADPPPTDPPTRSALEFALHGPGAPPGPGIDAPGSAFLLPQTEREDDRLGEVARVDGTGMPTSILTPERIRAWFTRPTGASSGPEITVTRVVDPEEYTYTEAYEVPERARRATLLRDRSCIFPFCHAIADRADCDHTVPFDEGGPTCTCNLAALCRFHHRLKTHGQHSDDHRWTYAGLGRGEYLWSGPNGILLLRTARGTTPIQGDLFTVRPDDGAATPGVTRPDGSVSTRDPSHPAFDALTNPLALPLTDMQGRRVPVSGFALRHALIAARAMGTDPDLTPARARPPVKLRARDYLLPPLPDDPEFAPAPPPQESPPDPWPGPGEEPPPF